MRFRAYHSAKYPHYSWKILCIFSLFFLFSIAATAQNTKGDKPISNQKQVRESKGKARAQKGNKKPKTKDIAGRRLRTKDKSSANRANVGIKQPDPYRGRKKTKGDRTVTQQAPIFVVPPREQQRAWSGDISGKPIRRITPSKSGVARNNVYPQTGRYVTNPSDKPRKEKPKIYTKTAAGKFPRNSTPQVTQRAWKGNIKGGPIGTPSRTGQTKNTYKQFGEYGRHQSYKPRTSDKIRFGDRATIRSFPPSSSPWSRSKKYGTPPSASQSFLSRGKKNVYWGKFSKSGKPVTTDLTGRPLRTRNYRSTPAGLIGRDTLKGFGRRPGGDRANRQSGGGFISTRKGQQAWTGDIAGKSLRRIEPRSQQEAGEFFFRRKLSISKNTGEVGKPLPGGGVTANWHKRQKVEKNSLPVRLPGIGGTSIGKYLGNLKGRRTIKGGGSVSGKRWNNKGMPIDVNRAGSGTIRASKFQGNYYRGELSPGFSPQGEGYSGNIKARRPVTGGGSISGQLWNNKGQPVDVNGAGNGTIRASKFQGNIKTEKPLKGGGSISGKLWNNKGLPIDVNGAGNGTIRASKFQGNIKTGKPLKGGGSVSGKLWNNNGLPIDVNGAGNGTIRASKFQGNIKTGKPLKGGGSVSGKLWNNNGLPIDVNGAGKGTISASQFQGNIKTGKPLKGGGSVSGKLWNNNGLPIDVNSAGSGTISASQFKGKTKEGSLFRRGYVQNPNSADEALKVTSPGKVNARLGDFQGNVKMYKYNDSRLHPDSKFAHNYQDNVKEERTFLTNVKLFWAKVFRKSETQPDHLKEKIRKPRYDKGEVGLWHN